MWTKMEIEDFILKERILKEFMNHHFGNQIPVALKNIDSPLYTELSERLQLPKRKNFNVISENQPRILVERNR